MAMPPKLAPLRVRRGSPIAVQVAFYEGDPADDRPLDLDSVGWTSLEAPLKRVGQVRAAWNLDVPDPAAGKVHLILHSADTAALDAGTYSWDLRVINVDDPNVRASGTLLVLED